MSEVPIPEKKSRPGGLVDRLQNIEPDQDIFVESLLIDTSQRLGRTKSEKESLDSEVTERIEACVAKWRELLKYKYPFKIQFASSPTFVRAISLLEPDEETRHSVNTGKRITDVIELPILEVLSRALSEYAKEPYLARYAPRHVHTILYDRKNDATLFPKTDVSKYAGFHRPLAKYPAIFWPLEQKEDATYFVTPFVLGHEFGEVIISTIEQKTGENFLSDGASRHFLKEGLCDAVGFDFYSFVGKKEKDLPSGTYDEVILDSEEDPITSTIDAEMSLLSREHYKFAEYRLGGSLVTALANQYGFEKVLDYFAAEAIAEARREKGHRQKMKDLETPGVSVSFTSSDKPVRVPPNKQLEDLLTELGYTRHDFEGASSESEPFDMRPEGSIAAAVYAECSGLVREYEQSKRETGTLLTGPRSEKRKKGPSYADKAIKSLDTPQAKEVFGPDFSAHDFVMSWREKVLDSKE